MFRQTIDLPDAVASDEDFLGQLAEASESTGWNYNATEQRFERLVTYEHIDVSVNDNETVANAPGSYSALRAGNEPLEINVYDPTTGITYSQLLGDGSDTIDTIIDIDISPMLTIDSDNESLVKNPLLRASTTDPYWTDGEEGVYGYRLHCNRFNGYLGDGCYYDNELYGLLNFFASDCDWALGSYTDCLADYGSNPFCAASPASKQASCSGLIDHYKRFHMHTTYSGN
jgi:hypothetical protein